MPLPPVAATPVPALLLALTPATVADVGFTGRAEFGLGASIPAAWGDFDRDGDQDLAVGNFFSQANRLYVNDGAGGFVEHGVTLGTGSTFALAWGDFDADGDLDLAVGNDGANRLLVNRGDGSFDERSEFGAGRTVALAWADADGDGDLDLAVGNGILGTPQANRLYRNQGDGTFVGEDQFGVGQTDSLAWCDADGDGDQDLAVGNGGFSAEGANAYYRNDGGGTFTEIATFGLGDTAAVAWGDADGDGHPDLAAANWAGGTNRVYLNDGSGAFTAGPAFGAADTNTLAWADFDHDGDEDIAVGNGDFTSADANALYVNDGAGGFEERTEFGVGSTDGVAWADVDGDGDLDLAVVNEHSPTQNELWVSDLGGDAWLRVRLVGRHHELGAGFSNRDGIGACVTVFEAGHLGSEAHRIGRRWVSAHGGFAAQNPIGAHFGLGPHETVDVRIEWPGSEGSRIVQDLRSVVRGQAIEVMESPPGDLDGDGVIGVADLLEVLSAWGPCPACPADLDGDGSVGVADLLMLLGGWSA